MTKETLAELLLIKIKGRLTDEVDIHRADILYHIDIVADSAILEMYFSSRKSDSEYKALEGTLLKSEIFGVKDDSVGKYLQIPNVIHLPRNRGIEGVYKGSLKIPEITGLHEVAGIDGLFPYWWPEPNEDGVRINLWDNIGCEELTVRYAKSISSYGIREEILLPEFILDSIFNSIFRIYLQPVKVDETNDGV